MRPAVHVHGAQLIEVLGPKHDRLVGFVDQDLERVEVGIDDQRRRGRPDAVRRRIVEGQRPVRGLGRCALRRQPQVGVEVTVEAPRVGRELRRVRPPPAREARGACRNLWLRQQRLSGTPIEGRRQHDAAGLLDGAQDSVGAPVLRRIGPHGHPIADGQRVGTPAHARERQRGGRLDGPLRGLAVRVRGVDADIDVRVAPAELGDRPLEFHQRIGIDAHLGVVRRGGRQQQDGCGENG